MRAFSPLLIQHSSDIVSHYLFLDPSLCRGQPPYMHFSSPSLLSSPTDYSQYHPYSLLIFSLFLCTCSSSAAYKHIHGSHIIKIFIWSHHPLAVILYLPSFSQLTSLKNHFSLVPPLTTCLPSLSSKSSAVWFSASSVNWNGFLQCHQWSFNDQI